MGDASAYESLGLSPGADQAEVERAYKRLIKEHHPDREGGDSRRAAEINRAYRELRGPRSLAPDALEFNEHPSDERRFSWAIPLLIVTASVGALVYASTPVGSSLAAWSPSVAQAMGTAQPVHPMADPMDVPLHAAAITGAIRKAQHLSATSDEMKLAAESSECHARVRTDPDMKQLDGCLAFDDAVVVLQDRDPLRDRGPFSELAVTGRQWSSAATLSSDYLAIDGRLDRIRTQVELALAPDAPAPDLPAPVPAPAPAN